MLIFTGCRKLIITDYDTCSTDYSSPSDIPDDTEVSCLPPNLEIIHDPLEIGTVVIIETYLRLMVMMMSMLKILLLRQMPGLALSQIWQISRILDSLQLDESTGLYTCDYDVST